MKKINLSSSSIRAQLVFAFGLLVLPLAIMSYYFDITVNLFDNANQINQGIHRASSTVRSVERDIYDLQRNVLIIKETSSRVALKNAYELGENIHLAIDKLITLPEMKSQLDSLVKIRNHLLSYMNSLQTVVLLRKKRQHLVDQHMAPNNWFWSETHRVSDERRRVNQFMLLAHAQSLSYLTDVSGTHLDGFKKYIIAAKQHTQKLKINAADRTQRLEQINLYETTFLRIVTITRHYTYLVNVVMTGSASEILHLAGNISNDVSNTVNIANEQTADDLAQQERNVQIFTLASVLMVLVVSLYFFRKITTPIHQITHVFNALADGEEIDEIPGKDRRDELGLLASAASVFKDKNDQTLKLLEDTEIMVFAQRRLNSELRDAKARAEGALRVKSDFLANMSHELRTPLNSIIGFTVRLLKKPESHEERHLTALQTVHKNSVHLLNMINDILDLSKLEANKFDLNIEPCDLSNICHEAMAQMTPPAEDKNLHLVCECEQDKIIVETDGTRVQQILLNLLSNAIKYTREGEVRIELMPLANGQVVRLNVCDTGIGISREDQQRLFQRFEQFDDSTRFQVGQGTGLGLAIVYNLSKILNISVLVSSESNKGSTFSLSIPIKYIRAEQLMSE